MCPPLLLSGMLYACLSGISGLVGSPYHLYLDDLAHRGKETRVSGKHSIAARFSPELPVCRRWV